VAEYAIDSNASQAAIRAGYTKKNANVVGPRLLANVHVKAAVALLEERQLQNAGITAEMVKRRLGLLAFQDVRKLFDRKGNILPLQDLDDDTAPMIAGMEVIIKNAKAGDGHTDEVHKIRIVDQVKPLELLARHFGLLVEQAPIPVNVTFVWQSAR